MSDQHQLRLQNPFTIYKQWLHKIQISPRSKFSERSINAYNALCSDLLQYKIHVDYLPPNPFPCRRLQIELAMIFAI